MRTLASFIILSMFLMTGCDSLPTGVRERFGPVPPKVREFDGDLRTVYNAAEVAFKRLDFVLTDASGAPTHLEASSPISTSDSMGDSRQLVVTIRLRDAGQGRTEVEALVSLQVENSSLGGVAARNQREHGFYESFFTTVQQVLQERATSNK